MKFLSRLFAALIMILAITLALSNRARVGLDLWPFDLALDMPLGLIVIAMLLLGMTVGASVLWLTMLPHKRHAKRLTREMVALRSELSAARSSAPDDAMPAPRSFFRRPRIFGGPAV